MKWYPGIPGYIDQQWVAPKPKQPAKMPATRAVLKRPDHLPIPLQRVAFYSPRYRIDRVPRYELVGVKPMFPTGPRPTAGSEGRARGNTDNKITVEPALAVDMPRHCGNATFRRRVGPELAVNDRRIRVRRCA